MHETNGNESENEIETASLVKVAGAVGARSRLVLVSFPVSVARELQDMVLLVKAAPDVEPGRCSALRAKGAKAQWPSGAQHRCTRFSCTRGVVTDTAVCLLSVIVQRAVRRNTGTTKPRTEQCHAHACVKGCPTTPTYAVVSTL